MSCESVVCISSYYITPTQLYGTLCYIKSCGAQLRVGVKGELWNKVVSAKTNPLPMPCPERAICTANFNLLHSDFEATVKIGSLIADTTPQCDLYSVDSTMWRETKVSMAWALRWQMNSKQLIAKQCLHCSAGPCDSLGESYLSFAVSHPYLQWDLYEHGPGLHEHIQMYFTSVIYKEADFTRPNLFSMHYLWGQLTECMCFSYQLL